MSISEVQAILFAKDGKYNTIAKQKKWMNKHGLKLLKGKDVHVTDKYFRWRVRTPNPEYEKRFMHFVDNVYAIIEFKN